MDYTVYVREPYASGAGCDSIWHALSTSVWTVPQKWISGWGCKDDGTGMTKLTWASSYNAAAQINSALEEVSER